MSRLLSVQFADPVFAGEYGNYSVKAAHYVAAAAQVGDTIDFFTLPGKCRIHEWTMLSAALGGTATLSLGWRYADGSAGGSATALLPASAVAAASRTEALTNLGQVIDVDKDVIIYGTLGGSAATGRVD